MINITPSEVMKIQLSNRLKSFAWRLSMATIVFVAEWVSANAGLLDLDIAVTGVIALLAGEVSKFVNNKKQGKI